MNDLDEWAPEGALNAVGQPEKILRYQESAYVGMREWVCYTPSRVAPQELMYSCPSRDWDKSFFIANFKKGCITMSAEKIIPYKIYLTENEMPSQWYNVRADMKIKPAPLLNPETLKPMTYEDLRPVFCDELIKQELDENTAYIDIPQEILLFQQILFRKVYIYFISLSYGLADNGTGTQRYP